jgi:hypothetical protein
MGDWLVLVDEHVSAEGIWKKLYEALANLAAESGGDLAFVIDIGNVPWCIARATPAPWLVTMEDGTIISSKDHMASTFITQAEERAAARFYKSEMVPRLTAMRRGTRFDVAKTEGDDCYVGMSFAGIYAVAVWFDEPFDPAFVRLLVRRALPEIEALTLGLPPSGGPGFDAGAQKIRA